MSLAGLLLAAGAGRRYGGPKALVRFRGELLVERGVRLLTGAGCDPVLVVLGAEADRVRAAASLGGARLVVAAGWDEGMGASLRAGLAAMEDTAATGAVVTLADQPLVGAGAVARLRAAWSDGAVAAVATYAGTPGHPVLLDRSVWSAVAAGARGDQAGRVWLRAHPEDVVAVGCDGTGSPYDIDTPADLTALLEETG